MMQTVCDMRLSHELRLAIVSEAQSWVDAKTPFHHRAAVKGAGVDCACIIAESYNAVLDKKSISESGCCPTCGSLVRCLREFEKPATSHVACRNIAWHALLSVQPYYDQWHLHRGDELYLNDLKMQGFTEITPKEQQPADLAISRVGHLFSHGAIVVDWPRVIQSESGGSGKAVLVKDAMSNWFFQHRAIKFFSWSRHV